MGWRRRREDDISDIRAMHSQCALTSLATCGPMKCSGWRVELPVTTASEGRAAPRARLLSQRKLTATVPLKMHKTPGRPTIETTNTSTTGTTHLLLLHLPLLLSTFCSFRPWSAFVFASAAVRCNSVLHTLSVQCERCRLLPSLSVSREVASADLSKR
jgi:hypothetical protein